MRAAGFMLRGVRTEPSLRWYGPQCLAMQSNNGVGRKKRRMVDA